MRSRFILLAVGLLVGVLFVPNLPAYTRVSPWTLAHLPSRMARVTPGMAEAQVWQTLGLPGSSVFGGDGGGPANDYRMGYSLPYGWHLVLVFDETRKPAAFKRGRAWQGL